jgi:hypothetical protein
MFGNALFLHHEEHRKRMIAGCGDACLEPTAQEPETGGS